jgi:integrase
LGKYLENTYGPAMVKANRKAAAASKARIKAAWEPLMEKPLAQITEGMIEKVIEGRKALEDEEGEPLLSHATLRRDWATFRPLLRMAHEQGLIATFPVIGIPKPLQGMREEPRRRYLGQDDPREPKRFFDALAAFKSDEPGGPEFLRVACILALNTGCRRGELVQLRDDMLRLNDLENERIELPGWACKSGKPRDLFLNPDAIAAIKRWQEVRKTLKVQSVDGALFPGKAQNWKDRISQREFPQLCVEAKIEDLVYKDLRCTFASRHVQSGTPIQEVQKMLGHSSVTVTERHYAYLAKSAGKAAARAFRMA